jgi:hypothetical protein
MSCGNLGSPSADNSIRIYTKSERDQLGGNHYPSGECLKSEGGSYSWDCRDLNNQSSAISPLAQSLLPSPTTSYSRGYWLAGGAAVLLYYLMK